MLSPATNQLSKMTYYPKLLKYPKMDHRVVELIKTCFEEVDADDKSPTHHTYFQPAKWYSIRPGKQTDFWRGYCDIEAEGNIALNIGEKPSREVPVIIECTLKFKEDTRKLIRSQSMRPNDHGSESDEENENINPVGTITQDCINKFIFELVHCYQEAINSNFNVVKNKMELIACVLEQESDMITDNVRTIKMRVQFPFCKVDEKLQGRVIHPAAEDLLRRKNVLGVFPRQPIGDWDKIITKFSTSNAWPLYGSVTKSGDPKMQLTHIIPEISAADLEENRMPDLDLNDIFNIREHSSVHADQLDEDFIIDHEGEPGYLLPMFLSLDFCRKITNPRQGIDTGELKTRKIVAPSPSMLKEEAHEETELDMCEQLINLLSNTKFKEERYLTEIGKILWHTDNGGKKGLDLWIRVCESGGEYDSELCMEKWDDFSIDGRLTVKTLGWYARIDSPNEYKKWHKAKYTKYLKKATSSTHTDIARALYWIYWLDFTCSSVKNRSWFMFKNHIFTPCDNGRELKSKISSDFLNYFEALRAETDNRIAHLRSEDDSKQSEEAMLKKLSSLIFKLKIVGFKNNIMTEALEFFKDDNFETYANTNDNLMPLYNVIIETSPDGAIVRPGKPEDYFTIKSTVRWSDKMDENHPQAKKFILWMKQMYTDTDLREYVLKLVASCIKSKNKEKIFPCFVGEGGNNSKSMFKKLLEIVFGSMSFTFPLHIMTGGGKNKSGPSPELALARWAKIAFGQESDENTLLSASFLKEATGMDKIFARLCNQDGGNMEVMYTLFLFCNKLPIIPGADKAIMNRLRAVPHTSTWDDVAPTELDEQFEKKIFKRDKNFEATLTSMAPAAIWYFVEYYNKYAKEGLTEPAAVTKATAKYWKDNDMYHIFLKDSTERALIVGSVTEENPAGIIDVSKKVKVSELYQAFRWFVKESYPNVRVPAAPDFRFHLGQRLGRSIKGEYSGIVIKDSIAMI